MWLLYFDEKGLYKIVTNNFKMTVLSIISILRKKFKDTSVKSKSSGVLSTSARLLFLGLHTFRKTLEHSLLTVKTMLKFPVSLRLLVVRKLKTL